MMALMPFLAEAVPHCTFAVEAVVELTKVGGGGSTTCFFSDQSNSNGGKGKASNITGSSVYYAGGGGGRNYHDGDYFTGVYGNGAAGDIYPEEKAEENSKEPQL